MSARAHPPLTARETPLRVRPRARARSPELADERDQPGRARLRADAAGLVSRRVSLADAVGDLTTERLAPAAVVCREGTFYGVRARQAAAP